MDGYRELGAFSDSSDIKAIILSTKAISLYKIIEASTMLRPELILFKVKLWAYITNRLPSHQPEKIETIRSMSES